MKCPVCQAKTHVTNTQQKGNRQVRYRECLDCLTLFKTFEGYDFNSLPDYIQDEIVGANYA